MTNNHGPHDDARNRPDNARDGDINGLDVPTYTGENPATADGGARPLASDAPTTAVDNPAPTQPAAPAATSVPQPPEPVDYAPAPDAPTPDAAGRSAATPEFAPELSEAQTSIFESGKATPQKIEAPGPETGVIAAQPAPALSAAAPAAPAAVMTMPASPVADYPEADAAGEQEAAAQLQRRFGKRGTMDFGLLLLRLGLGGLLLASGVITIFNLANSGGLLALESDFAAYSAPRILALALPIVQLIAGVLLILGLLFPVGAALAIIATGFSALHELAVTQGSLSAYLASDGVWLQLLLFGLAGVVQFTGPGLISLDTKRSWARRPLLSAWLGVLVAVAAVVALWWFGAGINPVA